MAAGKQKQKDGERKFWVGRGQVLIAGKKYRTGEEIPVALVEPGRLDAWTADGLIADAPYGYVPKDASTAMVDGLNAQIVDLGQRLKSAEAKIKTQADVSKMESDLAAANLKVETLAGEVETLTAQVAELTDPAAGDGGDGGKAGDTPPLTGGGAGPGAKDGKQ